MKTITRITLCALALFACLMLASCKKTPATTHVVTFDVSGGTAVASVTVSDGATLTTLPETTREGYVFKGWYLDGEAFTLSTVIQSDITLSAYWEKEVATVNHAVTFKAQDGTVLKTEEVKDGESATAPSAPEVAGALFVYWDKDYTRVTSDLVVTAVYSTTIWTVSFYDADGVVLIATVEVGDGGTAVCPEAPAITGYAFTGWEGTYEKVHKNENCLALYEKIRPTVTFYDINGDILSYSKTSYGGNVVPPSAPAVIGKVFVRWDGVYQGVTEDSNVYAIYQTAMYDVTFYDGDGQVITTVSVAYGTDATAPDAPAVTGLVFTGWDRAFTNVTGNLSIRALYETQMFMVSFYGTDGTVLKTESVAYGYDAVAPTAPAVAGKTFSKWSVSFTNVTKNLTVTAIYVDAATVAVTFDAQGGTVNGSATYATSLLSGSTITLVPVYASHDFVGWLHDGKVVTVISTSGTYTACWASIIGETDEDAVKAALASLTSLTRLLRTDITLSTYDESHGVLISWETNGSTYLSADGTIHPTLTESHVVNLTATATKGSTTSRLTLSFIVARGVNELPARGICATYVYSGVDDLTTERLTGLDIIYMAFDSVTSTGAVAPVKSASLGADGIKRAHAAGTRVVISLQNKEAFGTIAASATLTATFVANVITMLTDYDLDGVDIDWEYPSSSQATTYTSLMKALYTGIKAKNSNWLVTSAIGAGPWQYNYFDLSHSAQYHDYINMMSYDMQSGGRGSFQNALYYTSTNGNYYLTSECTIQATVKFYRNSSIKDSQIIVGIAFYGRIFSGCSGMGKSATSVSSISYSSIKKNYLSALGTDVTYTYDTAACAPYIVASGTSEVITYDDPTSIAAKAAYCEAQGLAGLMSWQFGQDSATDDLLNAMKTSLTRVAK